MYVIGLRLSQSGVGEALVTFLSMDFGDQNVFHLGHVSGRTILPGPFALRMGRNSCPQVEELCSIVKNRAQRGFPCGYGTFAFRIRRKY